MTDPKSLLSKPWQKFFLQLSEHKTTSIESWKPIHLLGYFDFQYEKYYQDKYCYSLIGQPSKCFELVVIKKLFTIVDSTKQEEVKKYLDWIFEYKIKPKNYQMRKMSFLLSPGFGNEFRLWRENHTSIAEVKKEIYASSQLPKEIKDLTAEQSLGFPIVTYGDLAQFRQAFQSEPSYFPSAPIFFARLQELKFDIDSLRNL